jgi:chromosome segregation ATPase
MGFPVIEQAKQEAIIQAVNTANANAEASNNALAAELRGEIDAVEIDIDGLQNTLNTIDSRLSSAESTISTHTAQITTINSDISELLLRIQALESGILLKANTIDVNNAIANLQEQIDALTP